MRYLPAYCPHLNLIEGVWPKVKGLLMPRRFYDPVSELKKAVSVALRLLGAAEIHIQVGDRYLSSLSSKRELNRRKD